MDNYEIPDLKKETHFVYYKNQMGRSEVSWIKAKDKFEAREIFERTSPKSYKIEEIKNDKDLSEELSNKTLNLLHKAFNN